MASKKEVAERIAKALQEKTGGQHPCPICGERKWVVSGEFSPIAATNEPAGIRLGSGPTLPLMPVICNHCGNTQFINLLVLGFSDLSELKIDKDE